MTDLREWLRGNKLEQYAEVFEANDIDLDVLPDLNEHDLERLGLSLVNRRRLLKAISRLKNSKYCTAENLEFARKIWVEASEALCRYQEDVGA